MIPVHTAYADTSWLTRSVQYIPVRADEDWRHANVCINKPYLTAEIQFFRTSIDQHPFPSGLLAALSYCNRLQCVLNGVFGALFELLFQYFSETKLGQWAS